MKNMFLQISIGASIMMCSAAFLISSINPSQATPKPEKNLVQGTNGLGKYQMTLTFAVFPDASSATRALVWDTETGKSVYYRSEKTGWIKQDNQLPSNPIGN